MIEAEQPMEQPTDDLLGSRQPPSDLKGSERFEKLKWPNYGRAIVSGVAPQPGTAANICH
jgi:hypothetical protein